MACSSFQIANIVQLRCNNEDDGADDLSHIRNKTYTSFVQFRVDIMNFTKCCNNKFPNSKEISKSAKTIIQLVNTDVKHIKLCSQCYKNGIHSSNPMVLLCDPPHLMVWAKTDGYNYWSAKIMSVGRGNAHVIYFGEYSECKIPVDKCFLYLL